MQSSKENLQATLNHRQPEKIVFDMGSNSVTGIHVRALEKLRKYYGLENMPVRVIEPYQMLGMVENDLIDAIGVDVIGIWGESNLLGFGNNAPFKTVKTFWGQEVLVPEGFSEKLDENGNLLSFPNSNNTLTPSARMPKTGYFFDAIERQQAIDERALNVADNLEEFSFISDNELNYWENEVDKVKESKKGIMASFGGTALGDIALVPGMQLKNPKGIRSITEWYMSTVMRVEYVKDVFSGQTEIALENLKRIFKVVGNHIDVVFICGTDFGTQNSTFCAPEQFDDLWMPYYQQINNWIHENTTWKTFKHSCGAVESFMSRFVEAGFDIINPVQISAANMDPVKLKKEYGKHLTFWGGGVDTQQTLPYKKPAEVREEVLQLCEVFGKDGGFVFNTVHNIQADVPVENIVAMIDAISEFNK